MILLETPDDIMTVMKNWHENILMIVTDMYNQSDSHEQQDAYNNILELIHSLPIDNQYTINERVMENTVEYFESYEVDSLPNVAIPSQYC